MTSKPRKLAELWEVDGDYQIRVMVGAFQRHLTPDPAQGEDLATYEVVEVLRKIVADFDANRVQIASDDRLPPPGA
jgi:hypothetical protein